MDNWTDRQIDGQIDGQAGKQIDKQTGRQTDMSNDRRMKPQIQNSDTIDHRRPALTMSAQSPGDGTFRAVWDLGVQGNISSI